MFCANKMHNYLLNYISQLRQFWDFTVKELDTVLFNMVFSSLVY